MSVGIATAARRARYSGCTAQPLPGLAQFGEVIVVEVRQGPQAIVAAPLSPERSDAAQAVERGHLRQVQGAT
jgi:hypothetical protein